MEIINLENAKVTFKSCDPKEIQEDTQQVVSMDSPKEVDLDMSWDVDQVKIERLCEIFKENRVLTIKEQLFQKFFPEVENIDRWVMVVPKDFELDGILLAEPWVFVSDRVDVPVAVKIGKA